MNVYKKAEELLNKIELKLPVESVDQQFKIFMEAIIFCGIQASGKTTFYIENFFKTHVRISLDLLNTRRKENIFLQTCLETKQRFVIDNTNATKKERLAYIEKAKQFKFKVTGYYFEATVGEAITRNKNRTGKEIVPPAGIGGTFKRLQVPAFEEGFYELYKVKIVNNSFIVETIANEGRLSIISEGEK